MIAQSHVYIVESSTAQRDELVSIATEHGSQPHPYSSSEAFLADAPFRRPGCLIVDMKQPSLNGDELHRQLAEHVNPLPMIVISDSATVETSVRVMEKGAITLLEKPFEPGMLRQYIEKAIEYDRCQTDIYDRYRELQRRWAKTSERQRRVLDLIVEGLPSKAIAVKLDVSQRTIEIERSRLLSSFDAESTPELVAKTTEYRVLMRFGYHGLSTLRKHVASSAEN